MALVISAGVLSFLIFSSWSFFRMFRVFRGFSLLCTLFSCRGTVCCGAFEVIAIPGRQSLCIVGKQKNAANPVDHQFLPLFIPAGF